MAEGIRHSKSVAEFPLEVEGGGGLGDDALEVGDLFGVHAVIDVGKFLLSALDGGFGVLFVDFRLTEGHVREDDDLGLGNFGEARTHGHGDDLTLVEVAEFTRFEGRNQTGVHRQHSDFAIRARQIDVVHGIREHLLLRSDDVELERHLDRS